MGDSNWRRSASLVAMTSQPQRSELRASLQQLILLEPMPGACGGTLGNYGQRHRFSQIDAVGRFTEEDSAGGADTLHIAAERRDVQVRFQQLALRIAALQPECGRNLTQLPRRASGLQPVKHPRQLHG